MGLIIFEAAYLPRHGDNPVFPSSGEELAAVVDEMYYSDDESCDYLTIFVIHPDGSHLAQLGVGVRAGADVGSIYFVGPEGAFFSKGTQKHEEPIVYYDFGNMRFFASDSQIDIHSVKNALVHLYQSGGQRPDNVEWQDWFDAEPAENLE